MRRQVKPFVTEYRGSPRRSKDLQATSDVQQDMTAPRSRAFVEAEKAFHIEVADDSYEAALRAADALFDTKPRKAKPERGTAISDTSQPQNTFSASSLRPPFNDEGGKTTVFDTTSTLVDPVDAKDTSGSPRRILQAIEPASNDRFAELEAEHAPKRRGRKPGSKNKPKATLGDDWPATRIASSAIQALSPVATEVSEPADAVDLLQDDDPAVAVERTSGDNEPVSETFTRPRGRSERFGWKRAGLRPGERWKRRLPKVAW